MVKGKEVILSTHSPAFKGMLFRPIKEEKDVVQVEETTVEAFKKLVEYIYQVDIDCKNMTLLELYDIVNLAEMYDMPKLMDELKIQMRNIPLTKVNVMEVAHTAAQFEQYKEVSAVLLLTCSRIPAQISSNLQLIILVVGGRRQP